ncbi:MAG: spermidine synthase [Vulcanimicrobiota bacterium]
MRSRLAIPALVLCAGFAALSWEVLWQLEASLALGVSALGTAITLATTMGGMSLGSLAMGAFLRHRPPTRPLRVYALLEGCIGVCGLLLKPGFALLERLDSSFYLSSPTLTPALHMTGMVVVLGVPAMAMGASVPVFGLVAARCQTSISRLYALNTAGAAVGCLAIALFLIRKLGVSHCAWLAASLNLGVAVVAFFLPEDEAVESETSLVRPAPPPAAGLIVFLTGYATFALEVAWFRSLRAAFHSTTESFAIMLAAVLIALALAAVLVPILHRRIQLPLVLALAGLAVLVVTPLVERFDLLPSGGAYWSMLVSWMGHSLLVLGTPVCLLGMVLPWVLDAQTTPADWARCYALNTFGAILGAISAAWLWLPLLGFARTAWLVGGLVSLAGCWLLAGKLRIPLALMTLGALACAARFESGVGRQRIQGHLSFKNYKVLAAHETPDSTVSAVELSDGERALVIDGFEAADERREMSHYMEWMGRLPMILHPHPERSLIICFGTGQTTNGVRREGDGKVDVVELNRVVLEMAPLFTANEGVLTDPRVTARAMDGRAWLRRTDQTYDVITLEPMPPNFAGVNALYSREFYALARQRLAPGGVVAQWVPFHLLAPYHATSIARTFQDIFPNSGMWIDPVGFTGILVGSVDGPPIGQQWPGLGRDIARSLTDAEVEQAMVLGPEALRRYGALGDVITDDNQLLAYGASTLLKQKVEHLHESNLALLHWASSDPPPANFSSRPILELRTTLRARQIDPAPAPSPKF